MSLDVRAVIFAGGPGSRLFPLVGDEFPKPMLPVATRPMLFYSLFSLIRSRILDITIVTSARSTALVTHYVNGSFLVDPLATKLNSKNVKIHFVESAEGQDTADVLRTMRTTDSDYIVMSCDYIGNIDLEETFRIHRATRASCTVTLRKTGPKDMEPADTYAMVAPKGNRLLGLYFSTDLDGGVLKVRGTLLQKFPSLQLRSDIADTHIYMFSSWVLNHLLQQREAISSVKFDLVPYLARRQFTLSRDSVANPIVGTDIVVSTRIVDGVFAARVNNVDSLLDVNLAVAKGTLDPYLPSALSKDKNFNIKKLARKGDKTSVSVDSVIGTDVSAGDRTSIKKSVIGTGVAMGSQVKLNGCVVGDHVKIADNANLTSTIVSFGSTIQTGCKLKDCHVAPNFVVSEGTEATGKKFSLHAETTEDFDLGDIVSFA